jgi:hypothetical protein
MKRALPTLALGCFLATAGQAGTVTLHRPLDTVYDIYLGGIRIGELSVDARVADGRYEASSAMRTAGIVGALYAASYVAEAEGAVTPDGLRPARFVADTQAGDDAQAVDMRYAGGRPSQVSADPPFKPKPWEIEPRAQAGTLDPISAALSALAPAPASAICDRTVEIYDGRRRYAVDIGRAEPEGDRIRCPAHYRRVAGYKPKELRETYDVDLWFEDRPDGLAHLVRAAGDSGLGLGLAVLLLRE